MLLLATHCEVQWTADARFVYVHADDAQAMGGTDEATAIELSTGKKQAWSAEHTSCISGDDSAAGERAANDCHAARTKAEREYDRATTAWLKAHPASNAGDGNAGKVEHAVVAGRVHATLTVAGHPPRESVFKDAAASGEVTSSTAPDGQWVVLCPAGTESREWTLLPGLARLDLLDAGAGSLDAAAAKLKAAGIPPAHTGKSQSPHAKIDIFYAVGFEADAKQVAAALGLDPAVAKPVTWSTPFAITVALAKATP